MALEDFPLGVQLAPLLVTRAVAFFSWHLGGNSFQAYVLEYIIDGGAVGPIAGDAGG